MRKFKNLSMNMKLFILLAVIAIIGIIVRWEYIKTEASRSFKFFRHEKQNEHYTVHTVADGLISIDGERTDAEWNSSDSISSFVNPWNTSVCPETSLWMLKDSRFLYFFFDVKDDDIVLVSEFSRKEDVGREDRAELFFSKDKDMHDYYCFEIDALGRTLAYSCSHYRKYNYGWEPPVGFLVSTRIRPDGYSVEGALPLDFIHDFIQSDGSVYMGAYRAEYSKNEGLTVENWLTWINPRTAHPDFHVPESMGKILLVNSENSEIVNSEQ